MVDSHQPKLDLDPFMRRVRRLIGWAILKGATPHSCILALDGVRAELEKMNWHYKSRSAAVADLQSHDWRRRA